MPLRGCEQRAEIISWEIGDRVFMPSIPNNGPSDVDAAFERLAGRSLGVGEAGVFASADREGQLGIGRSRVVG